MKEYTKINFRLSSSIEQAVLLLLEYKAKGVLVYGDFNGTKLYSDTVTMDGAYKEIVGKTKKEFDKSQQEWLDRYDREKREHEEAIPELSKLWMQKGREVLTDDKWEFWDKIVPIRLRDLYRGMELGCSLDIIEILNHDGSLDEAKKKIESQDHSGMSYGLVCSMVGEFCNRGREFVEYAR